MDSIKQSFLQICKIAKNENVQVELLINGGERLNLGFQKRKLKTFEASRSQTAGFRVVDESSEGYAYTENLSDDSLKLTFHEALRNARSLKASHQGEKSPVKIQFVMPSAIQELGFLNPSQQVSLPEKMRVAEILESAALDLDPRVQSVPYSGLTEHQGFERILNSEGLDVGYTTRSYHAVSYALAKDTTVAKSDYQNVFARDFQQLNPKQVAQKSANRALRMLHAKKLKTGKYPALIEGDTMSSFLAMLAPHLSAKNVLEGKSLLREKLGQSIASSLFELKDDPLYESGLATRPFDSEGSASRVTSLFKAGTLVTFLTHLESASRLGLENTANAARSPTTSLTVSHSNLVVAKGHSAREELLTRYPIVVVITQVTGGLHAGYKESTGDFSLPCEGLLYENGQLVGPVDQFVMSGNIFQFIQDIEGVGSEYPSPHETFLSPDVLVRSLSFAGATN